MYFLLSRYLKSLLEAAEFIRSIRRVSFCNAYKYISLNEMRKKFCDSIKYLFASQLACESPTIKFVAWLRQVTSAITSIE